MNITHFLVLALLAAFLGGYIARMIKLPLIVGYLGGGVAVSWFLNRWIGSLPLVNNIAEIGVAFLMFSLGLEFSLSRLKKLGEIIITGSLIQVVTTVIFCILFFQFLGFDFYNSLFLGSVFSLSSTAIVVKILGDKGELDTLKGEISVGWLLVQDVVTLLFIILLPSLGVSISSGSGFLWSVLSLLKALSWSGLLLILIFLGGRKIIPYILDRIAVLGIRELSLVAVVSLCLLFAVSSQYLGFPFALGAFMAGIIISPTTGRHAIFSEIRPLRDVFSVIFFVSLGFLIAPEFIRQNFLLILFTSLAVIVFKFVISDLLVLALGYHTKTAFNVGVSLISVGEFAFILSQLGYRQNLIGEKSYMLILAVAILTLAISSPLISHSDEIYLKIKNFLVDKIPMGRGFFNHFDKGVANHDILYNNHVIVLGHGRVGKYVAKALFTTNIPFIVVDYNNHLVKNLRYSGVEVIYGDPAEADVLKAAKIGVAKALVIAIPDRQTQDMVIANAISLNPSIKIICRSHYEEDQARLKSLGVGEIVQPEFEAAVSITGKLLRFFDLTPLAIDERIHKLKIDHGF